MQRYTAWLSSDYLQLVKDRLYCEPAASPARQAGLNTVLALSQALAVTIAPVLPHLALEVTQSYKSDLAQPN